MDLPILIKKRLKELGLEQRDVAAAAEVTESYISQLLTRKKLPPAPERTDIYGKLARILKLPADKLAGLADVQRKGELRKKFAEPPAPLFKEVRELILRKCLPGKETQIRPIFEQQPFGELERLVTQKILDVVKRVAREELGSENWLHLVARLSGRSYEQMRVIILEFLDTDVFNLTPEHCFTFLNPLIESWDIDLGTFTMEIVLNRRLAPGSPRKFEFAARECDQVAEEPGLTQFLRDPALSTGATTQEIEFLKKLAFKDRHPAPLYYYRELQNLRDPLHFRFPAARSPRGESRAESDPDGSFAQMQKHREAAGIERQLQLDAGKSAVRRRAGNRALRGKKHKVSQIRAGKTVPSGRAES